MKSFTFYDDATSFVDNMLDVNPVCNSYLVNCTGEEIRVIPHLFVEHCKFCTINWGYKPSLSKVPDMDCRRSVTICCSGMKVIDGAFYSNKDCSKKVKPTPCNVKFMFTYESK